MTTLADQIEREGGHTTGFDYLRLLLGSGLIAQSQKRTVAASAMAEKKTVGHRS